VRWLGLVLGFVGLGSARAWGAQAAESERTLQIWYRSSAGCPEGTAFVLRMNQLGREARLASVGDPIDFVVTVAHEPGQSSGRLEQQTALGTMAIREINAGRCEEVVDGLALSLDLALDPAVETASHEALERRIADSWLLSLGAGTTLATAIASDPMLGASLQAELSQRTGASMLFAVHGARDSAARGGVDLTLSLLEARAAACPFGWGNAIWMVQPCIGASLGWLGAESPAPLGRSDDGWWASGFAFARGRWRMTEALALYLDLGALAPFVRYELGADTGAAIFRTGSAGLEAGLGVAWSVW
jgi:hypothetical protein